MATNEKGKIMKVCPQCGKLEEAERYFVPVYKLTATDEEIRRCFDSPLSVPQETIIDDPEGQGLGVEELQSRVEELEEALADKETVQQRMLDETTYERAITADKAMGLQDENEALEKNLENTRGWGYSQARHVVARDGTIQDYKRQVRALRAKIRRRDEKIQGLEA